jgi:hypothetical protein
MTEQPQRGDEMFETRLPHFLRELIDLFGGPSHGVRVGVIEDGEAPLIEISGELPPVVRGGLKRAFAYWERKPRGGCPWGKAWAVWHLSHDGCGPRLAIPSLGALLDVQVARRLESEA